MTDFNLEKMCSDVGSLSETIDAVRGSNATALMEFSAELEKTIIGLPAETRLEILTRWVRLAGYLMSQLSALHQQSQTVAGGVLLAVDGQGLLDKKMAARIAVADDQARAARHLHSVEISNLQNQVRSLRERLNGREVHSITDQDVRQRVFDLASGRCHYCEVEITFSRDDTCPERCFHVDHIVARSLGGSDHFHNFIASCQRCNCEKGDRSFAEFIARKKRPDLRIVASAEASA